MTCSGCGRTPAETGTRVGPDAVGFTCPSCLMGSADRLGNVRPGLTPHEISAQLVSATPERQLAIHLCDLLKKTRDSAERAEIRARMDILVRENGHLKGVIKQELAGGVFGYIPGQKPGRPKKAISQAERQRLVREKSRARRAKLRGEPGTPSEPPPSPLDGQ